MVVFVSMPNRELLTKQCRVSAVPKTKRRTADRYQAWFSCIPLGQPVDSEDSAWCIISAFCDSVMRALGIEGPKQIYGDGPKPDPVHGWEITCKDKGGE